MAIGEGLVVTEVLFLAGARDLSEETELAGGARELYLEASKGEGGFVVGSGVDGVGIGFETAGNVVEKVGDAGGICPAEDAGGSGGEGAGDFDLVRVSGVDDWREGFGGDPADGLEGVGRIRVPDLVSDDGEAAEGSGFHGLSGARAEGVGDDGLGFGALGAGEDLTGRADAFVAHVYVLLGEFDELDELGHGIEAEQRKID